MWRGEEYTGRGGGGVNCDGAGASILYNIITNNTVTELTRYMACGAGINAFHYNSDCAIDIIIKGNQIVNNKAIGNNAQGAGVRLRCNAKVLDNNISFNSCEAQTGITNGIGILCLSDPTESVIFDVTFANNTISHNSGIANADYASGGGIFVLLSHASILKNEISYNEISAALSSTAEGAGITLWNASEHTVVDGNFIHHNVAKRGQGRGAGIAIETGNPQIINNVFSSNSVSESAGRGGGIYCRDGGHGIIINNTIVHNDARYGGGLYSENSNPVVINTILWGNSAETSAGIHQSGGSLQVRYSDIQGGWDGEGNSNLDPLFADETFHLSDNSPCIGAGIASYPIDGVDYSCPNMDCEYEPRPNPAGSPPDMGAFESPLGTDIVTQNVAMPSAFSLAQNYPNPFNPSTSIHYDLPKAGHVRLVIYDVLGRRICTLVDRREPAGRLQTSWDGLDERGVPVAGGLYFCRMQAGEFSSVIKMVFVK